MSWGLTGTARVSQCGDVRFSFFLGMGKQSFTATQSEARQAAWRARSRATTGSHSVPKPTSQDQSRGDPALQALRAQGAVLSGDAGPGCTALPVSPATTGPRSGQRLGTGLQSHRAGKRPRPRVCWDGEAATGVSGRGRGAPRTFQAAGQALGFGGVGLEKRF